MSIKKNKSGAAAIENEADLTSEISEPEIVLSPAKRIGRLVGWISFGFLCLIFFTLLKLPEDRIKAYIDGNIAAVLAERGISFTATEGRLSFLFGLSYAMKDITLNFPPPSTPVHIDKLEISPSILPLLFSTYSGKMWIGNGKGELSGSFSLKKTQFSLSYKSKKLELQKLGILPYVAGVQVAATVDGSGTFSGDSANLSSLEGEAALTLTQISLEPQSIAGFSVPQLSVSDAIAEIKADKGKAVIKSFRIGKPSPSKSGVVDDIQGAIAGDITLAKQLEASQINLKLHFTFSENIMKSFVLLDALLGAGKQPDGSYSFVLTGPLMSPIPAPVPAGG
ncbi:MAG: type II secretion system protein GspN [Bdellovibrionia bacterium]